MRTPTLVNTEAAVRAMLVDISSSSTIAVDCEGTDLDRNGRLCLLALAIPDGRTWVVDVLQLGHAAFSTRGTGHCSSLRDILQSPTIIKLLWDPRSDSDALYHQFQVQLQKVLDLQTAEVAYRRYVKGVNVSYVTGLAKALAEYRPSFQDMGFLMDKKAVTAQFDLYPKFWERRPLTAEMIAYCGHDVAHLFHLERVLFSSNIARRSDVANRVWAVSDDRTREWALPHAAPAGRHRAIAPRV